MATADKPQPGHRWIFDVCPECGVVVKAAERGRIVYKYEHDCWENGNVVRWTRPA